jgi:hypothetical protein
VLALGKPTVMVLVNGGILAIDFAAGGATTTLATTARDASGNSVNDVSDATVEVKKPSAIVEAFNLGAQGSRALAALLFGEENRYPQYPFTYHLLLHPPLHLSFASPPTPSPFTRFSISSLTHDIRLYTMFVCTPCSFEHNICFNTHRWGKLPVTIYPVAYDNEQDLANYDMAKAPGRTYRYYQHTPLWPFGWGLSLTSFNITAVTLPSSSSAATTLPSSSSSSSSSSTTISSSSSTISSGGVTTAADSGFGTYTVTVANTGSLAGDEVVLLFQRPTAHVRSQADHTLPIKRLIGFERVSVGVGGSAQVKFDVTKEMLALATNNTDGVKKIYPGEHELVFWRGNGKEVVFTAVVG